MTRLAIPSNRAVKLSKNPTLRAGQSYERRVSAWMERQYGMVPQVEFERHGVHCSSSRFIPDGLLFDDTYSKLVVVEIKTQYSEQAYIQIKQYMRWLLDWFPGPVSGLVICSNNPFLFDDDMYAKSPLDAFFRPFVILTMSQRFLPRIKDGLGMGKSTSHSALRSGGGSRHGFARDGGCSPVVAVARARGS